MGGGFALLGAAAWAGVIAYAVSIPAGTGALPLILGCVAITLAVLGVRLLARLSAMPAIATFDGQVVARWLEEDNSENGSGTVPQIAVDDAERAWAFAGLGGLQPGRARRPGPGHGQSPVRQAHRPAGHVGPAPASRRSAQARLVLP